MKRKNHKTNRPKKKSALDILAEKVNSHRLDSRTRQTVPYDLLFSYVRQMPGGTQILKELNYEQSIADWISSDVKHLDEILGGIPPLISFIQASKVNCHRNDDVAGFQLAYQAEKLLAKFPRKGGNAKTQRTNAIDRFYEAEAMCKETNKRFTDVGHNFVSHQNSETIELVREYVGKILGPLDRFQLIKGNCAGPGMINDLGYRTRHEVTPFFKYHDRLSATANARYFTAGMISLDYHWMTTTLTREGFAQRHLMATVEDEAEALSKAVYVVPGNRISFVPKDIDTDRAIAIEPAGNAMLQLGVGKYLKRRLMRWGINLTSQKKNQKLAFLGSILTGDKELATIDLSMASDTLAFEVVKYLLPRDWFLFLSQLRSPEGELTHLDGSKETIRYEKFSSMGNGYTFEVESLIFYAIVIACYKLRHGSIQKIEKTCSVFGDDIVCPTNLTSELIPMLNFFGFKVNESKSFITGKFKESCGKDYFLGNDVRPFFLRRHVETLKDLHFIANSLAHKSMELKTYMHEDAYQYLFSKIPVNIRLPGPLHFSVRAHWDDPEDIITDSLESCIRVPWDWACKNGYYRMEPHTFNCMYTEILVESITYKKLYAKLHPNTCENAMYHTFLQGVKKGDITLRDKTRNVVKNRVTTNWWLPKVSEEFEKTTLIPFDSQSRTIYHPLESMLS